MYTSYYMGIHFYTKITANAHKRRSSSRRCRRRRCRRVSSVLIDTRAQVEGKPHFHFHTHTNSSMSEVSVRVRFVYARRRRLRYTALYIFMYSICMLYICSLPHIHMYCISLTRNEHDNKQIVAVAALRFASRLER